MQAVFGSDFDISIRKEAEIASQKVFDQVRLMKVELVGKNVS
jgi:hypothetical protein